MSEPEGEDPRPGAEHPWEPDDSVEPGLWGDPFATFTEWASLADQAAYAALTKGKPE